MCVTSVFRLDPLHGATLAGLGAGLAVAAAVKGADALARSRRRGLFVRRRPPRRCARCAGFGIVRCELCRASGVCENPLTGDVMPCPRCTMSRHVPCALCNGGGARARAFAPRRIWRPTSRAASTLGTAAVNAALGMLALFTARSLLQQKRATH